MNGDLPQNDWGKHPKCRVGKSGEMHHLQGEMKLSPCRYAVALAAGAVAGLLAGWVPVAAAEPPSPLSPPVVSMPAAVPPPVVRPRPAAPGASKAPPRSSLTSVETQPSGAEIVGKMLAPGASDPDVPLPHPDLAERHDSAPESLSGPKLYGRGETGGGIIGLRVPIPVDRNGGAATTRSSVGGDRTAAPSQGVLESR
jgi:hypothetical protein